MNPTPPEETLEEHLGSLLEAYDAALAVGIPVESSWTTAAPAALQRELEGLQACLRRLEKSWPRRGRSAGSNSGTTPTDEARNDFFPQTPTQLGRFQIIRLLGHGGFGLVYLAWDPHLQREVALKVPRPEALLTPDARRRLLREAQTAAGLDHPHLLPLHEAGEAGPAVYLVSAYCPGPTLAAWLKERSGPVPVKEAARLLGDLAGAVDYMHTRGVLHRDLKPANILLEGVRGQGSGVRKNCLEGVRGQGSGVRKNCSDDSTSPDNGPQTLIPKITDFGLAKPMQQEAQLTRSGVMVGTPLYMAPEQAEGRYREVGPATDVYALGVILYELLTGQPPFRSESDVDTLRRIVSEEPLDPRRLRPDVPKDLQTICLKCLRKEPAQRYSTAGQLEKDLRHFLAGEPIQARPLSPWQRVLRWARRRPAAAGLVGVSTAALVGLLGGVIWHAIQIDRINSDLVDMGAREREQRILAEEREALLRHNVYSGGIRQATFALEKDEFVQAVEQLDRLRPEPGQIDLRGFEWYYLKGQCHPLHAVWRGHQDGVGAVAVSPDGRIVASASSDRTVRVWDLERGQVRGIFSGHTKAVAYLTFSPDGGTLASWSWDKTLRLWDVATATERVAFGTGPRLESVQFTPNGQQLVMAMPEGVEFRDANTGQAAGQFLRLPVRPLCMTITPDGKTVVTGHPDGPVHLWDISSARELFVLPAHGSSVVCLAMSPDGRTLASGSWDKTIRLWDVGTGKLKATVQGHRYEVFSVAFSPDGSRLASSAAPHEAWRPNAEGEVRLWDATSGAPLAGCERFAGRVNSLAFAAGGRLLVLGCSDHTVKLLDIGPTPKQESLLGHAPKQTWALAFAPDGKTLASAGDDNRVRLWDLNTGQQRATLKDHWKLVTAIAFTPDGRTVASASYDRTVKLWDPKTGKLLATLSAGKELLRCLAFSHDGKLLAAGVHNRHLKGVSTSEAPVMLWRVATKEPLAPLPGSGWTVRALAFSPDGTILASASEDGKIGLWDTSTWQRRGSLDDTDGVGCLAFAPDGKTLACGNKPGIIRIFDLTETTKPAVLPGHSKEIYALAFSPDGRTLATAGEDKTVRLWHAATGEELLVIEGHLTRVNAVAFSPDGRTLASGSHDGAVTLWRALPQETIELDGERHDYRSAPFGNDGKVTTAIGNGVRGFAAALQIDSKIVVAGTSTGSSGQDITLVRYHPDGRVDVSFGKSGVVTTRLVKGDQHANCVAVQPDGKILVAGYVGDSGNRKLALLRYQSNGKRDETFGRDGAVTEFWDEDGTADALAVQPDGKIVVAGSGLKGGIRFFALVRYTTAGELDHAFGDRGKRTSVFVPGQDWGGATSVAVQGDGKIVVTGPAHDKVLGYVFFLARYTSTGDLDTDFGTGGNTRAMVSGPPYSYSKVALQPDGKIVVAGSDHQGDYMFSLARFTAAGRPDSTFGKGGKHSTKVGERNNFLRALALQADGGIVLAGSAQIGSIEHFALARFTSDGNLDPHFGMGGKVTTDFGGKSNAYALLVQPDGKIVVVGEIYSGDRPALALARYRSDGGLDGPVKVFKRGIGGAASR
jgi:eukaryotic-like serine/threonine-protein kinase